jgi:hypothetical protein
MDEEAPKSTDGIKWSGRQKALDFVGTLANIVVDATTGKRIRCDNDTRIERLSQCWEPCEYYMPPEDGPEEDGRCGVCSCKVKGLTALCRKRCPVGKWEKNQEA